MCSGVHGLQMLAALSVHPGCGPASFIAACHNQPDQRFTCCHTSFVLCSLASPARSRLVLLSPMGKRAGSGPTETPSPYRRGQAKVFGLAQTPGIQGLMSGFHGTPVSNAMSAASWLHDMALRSPQQVKPIFAVVM